MGLESRSDAVARRVLVVDDDDLLLEVARTALQIVGGWTVTVARTGHEATASARADPPDAMLLDVMMPGIDGPGTVSALRADPATAAIPVIFLTAKASSEQSLTYWRQLGISGVIPKPFDPMTLSAQMAELLGWSGDR